MATGFVTEACLRGAIERQLNTANHLINIWFALKAMGLRPDNAVNIDTSNSTDSLKALFGYNHPEGRFFFPFAPTKRFLTAAGDMARSVVQTNIVRWAEPVSRGIAGVNPNSFLTFSRNSDDSIRVGTSKSYPLGLGLGEAGFARADNERIAIPDVAFALWLFRTKQITDDRIALVQLLKEALHLSDAEMAAVFVEDRTTAITLSDKPLPAAKIYELVEKFVDAGATPARIGVTETVEAHSTRIRSMVTIPSGPKWLNRDPVAEFNAALKSGASAILLYGAPRTGKTRMIDKTISPKDAKRETIQIHDGWTYDDLMISFRPKPDGSWAWFQGPLLKAIRGGKKIIVLEEINRTDFIQAVGELFLLLEARYRGDASTVTLKDGSAFQVPADVVIICTMNNLDRSTQRLDDALMARMVCIEVPPRVEDLNSLLTAAGIADDSVKKLRELFSFVQPFYSLGHGYFAELKKGEAFVPFYLRSIRPVLQLHLRGARESDLAQIDNKVDSLFPA